MFLHLILTKKNQDYHYIQKYSETWLHRFRVASAEQSRRQQGILQIL